jgi:hypothetical protein
MAILEDQDGNYLDPAAFNAAVDALQPYTNHAEVRASIAGAVVRVLIELRTAHGMGYMLSLVQGGTDRRRSAVEAIRGQLAKSTRLNSQCIDQVVLASAQTLA